MSRYRKACGVFVIWLLLLVAGLQTAYAEDAESYEEVQELLGKWCAERQYPDYFTGAWLADGIVHLGFLDDAYGHEEAEKILASLSNPNSVEIVYQKYSHNYLSKLMTELFPQMGEQGILFMGIQSDRNRLYIELSEQVAEEARKRFIETLTVTYGNAVFVGGEQTGYAVLTADSLFYSRSDLEGTLEKINKSVWFSLEKNTKTSCTERFRSILRGCFLAIGTGLACVLVAALLKVKTPAYVVSGYSDVNVTTERPKADSVNEQIKATMRYTSLQFDEKMMEEIDRHFS
ncbi:MAG: hypothetical protein K6E71_01270 [Lachnospiraceae bacterium]|nr:hypothetical protein [Lachnospiraceae bacterium]